MDQGDVAQAPDPAHGLLGLQREHQHVVQLPALLLVQQHGPLGAVADQQKTNVVAVAQSFRRVQHVGQTMRHAVSADIADHEFVGRTPFRRQGVVAGAGLVARQIDAVAHHRDLVRRNSPADEIGLEGPRQRRDHGRAAIEEQLDLLHQAQGGAGPHGAHSDNGRRPDVAQFEHERPPMAQGQQPAGEGGEELRRGRHHHVGPALDEADGDGDGHEAQEIEGSEDRAAIGGDEGLHPDDADAVAGFLPVPIVAIALVDLALGEVGKGSDDRHLVAPARPMHRALEHPGGGRVGFGRKVVGDEKNVHGLPRMSR